MGAGAGPGVAGWVASDGSAPRLAADYPAAAGAGVCRPRAVGSGPSCRVGQRSSAGRVPVRKPGHRGRCVADRAVSRTGAGRSVGSLYLGVSRRLAGGGGVRDRAGRTAGMAWCFAGGRGTGSARARVDRACTVSGSAGVAARPTRRASHLAGRSLGAAGRVPVPAGCRRHARLHPAVQAGGGDGGHDGAAVLSLARVRPGAGGAGDRGYRRWRRAWRGRRWGASWWRGSARGGR